MAPAAAPLYGVRLAGDAEMGGMANAAAGASAMNQGAGRVDNVNPLMDPGAMSRGGQFAIRDAHLDAMIREQDRRWQETQQRQAMASQSQQFNQGIESQRMGMEQGKFYQEFGEYAPGSGLGGPASVPAAPSGMGSQAPYQVPNPRPVQPMMAAGQPGAVPAPPAQNAGMAAPAATDPASTKQMARQYSDALFRGDTALAFKIKPILDQALKAQQGGMAQTTQVAGAQAGGMGGQAAPAPAAQQQAMGGQGQSWLADFTAIHGQRPAAGLAKQQEWDNSYRYAESTARQGVHDQMETEIHKAQMADVQEAREARTQAQKEAAAAKLKARSDEMKEKGYDDKQTDAYVNDTTGKTPFPQIDRNKVLDKQFGEVKDTASAKSRQAYLDARARNVPADEAWKLLREKQKVLTPAELEQEMPACDDAMNQGYFRYNKPWTQVTTVKDKDGNATQKSVLTPEGQKAAGYWAREQRKDDGATPEQVAARVAKAMGYDSPYDPMLKQKLDKGLTDAKNDQDKEVAQARLKQWSDAQTELDNATRGYVLTLAGKKATGGHSNPALVLGAMIATGMTRDEALEQLRSDKFITEAPAAPAGGMSHP